MTEKYSSTKGNFHNSRALSGGGGSESLPLFLSTSKQARNLWTFEKRIANFDGRTEGLTDLTLKNPREIFSKNPQMFKHFFNTPLFFDSRLKKDEEKVE